MAKIFDIDEILNVIVVVLPEVVVEATVQFGKEVSGTKAAAEKHLAISSFWSISTQSFPTSLMIQFVGDDWSLS